MKSSYKNSVASFGDNAIVIALSVHSVSVGRGPVAYSMPSF